MKVKRSGLSASRRTSARGGLLVLSALAAISLSACESRTVTSLANVPADEAKASLSSYFTAPLYLESEVVEVVRVESAIPPSITETVRAYSSDSPNDIADWFSRQSRMDYWVVTFVDKQEGKSQVVQHKDKVECTMDAMSENGKTTIVIRLKAPK